MNGGELIGEVLEAWGVASLFTLCGGHISPILVAARRHGIRVVDVRDEASAVFAADATARLSGRPGVAAVTAGPGLTNTITAVKNAQLAQSPVVVLGGATATVLEGKGALQDIDQLALMRPHVKWVGMARRVRELAPLLDHGLLVACSGVPGPVFLECPVDLLYELDVVRGFYAGRKSSARRWRDRALARYLAWHAGRLFAGSEKLPEIHGAPPPASVPSRRAVGRAAAKLRRARRPLLLAGSQVVGRAHEVEAVGAAVGALGVPVYLSGGARGLLGREHPLQLRHQRRRALREADLVLLAGVACDFRLDYGRHLGRATVIGVNLSREDLERNRRPELGVVAEPGGFLVGLAERLGEPPPRWADWCEGLRARDEEREAEISQQADRAGRAVNPLALCRAIEAVAEEDSVLVVDGGDFVGTASYVVRPRGPLRWLDPGVFGTLGVGGGFALGAKLARPGAEVWLLWGDGSAAFSLAEIDTMVRHRLPVIAIVGNDAGWTQIAREQVEILGDDVGTVLARTDYHTVAEGYGGKGLLLDRPERTAEVLQQAKQIAREGVPVVVNVMLDKTDFRKGSVSM